MKTLSHLLTEIRDVIGIFDDDRLKRIPLYQQEGNIVLQQIYGNEVRFPLIDDYEFSKFYSDLEDEERVPFRERRDKIIEEGKEEIRSILKVTDLLVMKEAMIVRDRLLELFRNFNHTERNE